MAAILCFGHWSTSAGVSVESVEMDDSKNLGTVVGVSTTRVLELEKRYNYFRLGDCHLVFPDSAAVMVLSVNAISGT